MANFLAAQDDMSEPEQFDVPASHSAQVPGLHMFF